MRKAISNLRPSSFIDCVMDGDDSAHITFVRLPALPLHCIVEHLFARVHPHIAGGILMLWPRVSRCKATCAHLISSIECLRMQLSMEDKTACTEVLMKEQKAQHVHGIADGNET